MPIGSGAADLSFAGSATSGLQGFSLRLILQVAREEELDHVALARRNRL